METLMTKHTDVSLTRDDTASTPEEIAALRALRDTYLEGHGLFTQREMAHLRFMRWLVQNRAHGSDQLPGKSDDPARRRRATRRS